jgi:hypothetical protein
MYIYVIAPKRMGNWRKGEKDVLFLMARWLFPRISPQALKEGQNFACSYISLCPS